MKTPPKLVTLVYCIRNNKILLAQRKKPPFVGYWVAPGGKIEPGESPHEGALRELKEETGLRPECAELRAIISETSDKPDWQWLIFVYRVLEPAGVLCSDEREGQLRWFDCTDLESIDMPEADRQFLPHVLSHKPGVMEIRHHYNDRLAIIETLEFGESP